MKGTVRRRTLRQLPGGARRPDPGSEGTRGPRMRGSARNPFYIPGWTPSGSPRVRSIVANHSNFCFNCVFSPGCACGSPMKISRSHSHLHLHSQIHIYIYISTHIHTYIHPRRNTMFTGVASRTTPTPSNLQASTLQVASGVCDSGSLRLAKCVDIDLFTI